MLKTYNCSSAHSFVLLVMSIEQDFSNLQSNHLWQSTYICHKQQEKVTQYWSPFAMKCSLNAKSNLLVNFVSKACLFFILSFNMVHLQESFFLSGAPRFLLTCKNIKHCRFVRFIWPHDHHNRSWFHISCIKRFGLLCNKPI